MLSIHEPARWQEYIAQSAQQNSLASGVLPSFHTEGFRVTNDWVRQGRPEWRRSKIYRNNHYVVTKSGKLVATVGNLNLRLSGFGSTSSWTCLDNHPEIYAGRRAS